MNLEGKNQYTDRPEGFIGVLADNKRFDNAMDMDRLKMEKRVLEALLAMQQIARGEVIMNMLPTQANHCVDCGAAISGNGGERCRMHDDAYRRLNRTKV